MPSGPLREVGAGGLSVYFIQTKSAIVAKVINNSEKLQALKEANLLYSGS
jgi:hypothetical protein